MNSIIFVSVILTQRFTHAIQTVIYMLTMKIYITIHYFLIVIKKKY